MRVVCVVHSQATVVTDITQPGPDKPAFISIFCVVCHNLLWQCISHVIASTACTESGKMVQYNYGSP